MAGLHCPPGRSGWWCGNGPCLACIPPQVQERPGSPSMGSGEVFTFSGLCFSCVLLPNIFEHLFFPVVLLLRFPGAPREAIFHQDLVGMESSTPPLVNSLLMSRSRGCFGSPLCFPVTPPPWQPELLLHLNNKSHRGRQAALLPREQAWGFFFPSFQTKNTPCIIQKPQYQTHKDCGGKIHPPLHEKKELASKG